MNVSKLILLHSVPKPQFSYILKKVFIGRIQLQSFSVGSCLFNDEIEKNKSKTLFTGIEQIRGLRGISKKKNQLSKLEDTEKLNKLKKGEMCFNENIQENIKKVVLEDSKYVYNKVFHLLTNVERNNLNQEQIDYSTDILIIGGGAVGLSIAYAIRNQFPHGPKVTVVDKDNSYPRPSTNLGQGLVSLQMFNEDEEEILILKYGAEFFSAFTRNTEIKDLVKFDLDYDPLGSLILVDYTNIEQVLKNNERLKKLGIQNKILDNTILKKKFPWLNVENINFGVLGMQNEGIINPWIYIHGLKCKCLNLGVNFVTAEIIDFGFENGSIRRAVCKLQNEMYSHIDFTYCVIAGGIESLNIVNLLNQEEDLLLKLRLPLEERMKYEYCFYDPNGPGLNTPIIINSDGTYFRREGLTGHYVTGVPSVIHNCCDDNSQPYQIFKEKVEPFLSKRMPFLKKINLVQGWTDVYDFCISNKVGITGPHPSSSRIIFALGFSHLGFQYLPGLGRGVMEYLIYDSYQTIDLKPFHIENLWRKQHLEEDQKRKLLNAQQSVALSE